MAVIHICIYTVITKLKKEQWLILETNYLHQHLTFIWVFFFIRCKWTKLERVLRWRFLIIIINPLKQCAFFFKFTFESHVSVWKKRAIICEIQKLIAITAVCFHYSSSYSRWIFGVFVQLVKFSQLINTIFLH